MGRYVKAGIAGVAGILILALAVGFLVGPGAPLEETIARSYNTNVYREQGGAKLVVASGGEIEVQSGGTLDVQGTLNSAGGDFTVADNLAVTGTSDLQGNVSDSGGDFTVGDNAIVTGTLDVQGASLNYGPNDLYPMGAGTSGFQVVWGMDTVTGTLDVSHGLTGPVNAQCALAADPSTGAGDAVACNTAISGGTVTIKAWQDDWAATTNGVAIYWVVIGTP